jgi:pyruvate/2-oxoglutarate dehydrogenase complex dihydrolipoamide dehydrogenase (E3) component
MTERAEVVVVGMGPGGENAAAQLAEAGLDVVGIEAELLGGECPYWGCVPSKMMLRAANLLAEGRRIPGMAGDAAVRPDWAPVAARIREEATDDWNDRGAVERFEGKGGRFVRGWGRFDGPGRVEVDGRVFEASRAVVVNIGTRPWAPPVEGLDEVPYWTNRGAIEAESVPASLAVLGGGAIGVELAQVFSRFGAEVSVLEAGPRLIGPEEPESGALLADVFAKEGIEVRTGVEVGPVRHDGEHFVVSVADGPPAVVERLLVATGRHPDLRALNVASLGLDEGARSLAVDERLRVEGVEQTWAIGDVTGKGAFTHVSMYQSDIVVADILRRDVVPADYRALSRVTFTDPEIGGVGLTERQARERGIRVRIGRAEVPASARGWIHKAGNRGFVKLVEDADRGVLVGATSAGPCGGEVLGLLVVAVHAAVPTTQLRHMIYAYPTFHRVIENAVRDLEET